jgi:LysR family transcriptional regulator, glycine cleavage system transcriptional activator
LLHDETIDFDADFPTWRSWLKLAKVAGVDAERGLRFSSSVMATQAAIDGQGVALGRSVIVGDDLAAGRLVRPFDVACPLDLGYHLVHPPQHVSRPNVAAFRAWILAEAGAHSS